MPLAPGRGSITHSWPSSRCSASDTARLPTSIRPPAGPGRITRIGLAGQVSARAANGAASAAPRKTRRRMSVGAIERLVAAHRHAMAVTAMREVVEHRVMLGAAVVPERHRVGLPLEAALELRRLDVAIEHLEQRIAFVLLELRDAQGETTIDVQPLPAGHRMGAH